MLSTVSDFKISRMYGSKLFYYQNSNIRESWDVKIIFVPKIIPDSVIISYF